MTMPTVGLRPRLSLYTPFGAKAAFRRQPKASGFSLTEVMLAIGILAVGLAMSMSVFPAAVKQNETSFGNVLGSLVAENGMTVAELAITPSLGNIKDLTDTIDDIDPSPSSPTKITRYPFKADAADTKGHWRVLANKDVLIVLAYRDYWTAAEPVPDDSATSMEINTGDQTILQNAPDHLLQNTSGTYIIDQQGNYAQVISKIDASEDLYKYKLDRDMPAPLDNSNEPLWFAKDVIAVRSMAISN